MRDLNGTQAAIRAGYKKSSARQQVSENLSKPYIVERVVQALESFDVVLVSDPTPGVCLSR